MNELKSISPEVTKEDFVAILKWFEPEDTQPGKQTIFRPSECVETPRVKALVNLFKREGLLKAENIINGDQRLLRTDLFRRACEHLKLRTNFKEPEPGTLFEVPKTKRQFDL